MRLIKVPILEGALGKNLGVEKAPNAVCKKIKIAKNKIIEIKMEKSNFEENQGRIYKTAKKIFNKKERCLFIGGDHSLTYSTFKAFSEKYKNAGLIFFDAHVDCMPSATLYSHEDIITGLAKEKKIGSKNLLMLGVRKIYKWEKPFLKKHKLKIIKSQEIKKDIGAVKKQLAAFSNKFSKIYVSVDVDVLDAKEMPATAYPVRGGLNKGELLELLDAVKNRASAFDLVEYNPTLDRNKKAGKIVAEIANSVLSAKN